VREALTLRACEESLKKEEVTMRILCLDDEYLALQMLETCIREVKPDAEVEGFDDQDELLESAEKTGCDVAFLDIHMRGMTGVEVAKRLKEINPKMNIIFVTGFSEYKGDAMDMKASGYIMKPVTKEEVAEELNNLRFPIVPKKNVKLRIQCFGNFDVFLPDGEHVRFERSKAKEVFAYLVHRHGSSCTLREIFAAIFEDEPYEKKLQNLLQTYIYAMVKSLKEVGAEDVIVRSYNALAVNPDLVDCDFYRFKELDPGAVNAYESEYMNQYAWADFLFNDY
jgi:two-component SAPR family response regulator